MLVQLILLYIADLLDIILTRVCGVTDGAFVWRWGGDGFYSLQ